MLKWMFYAVKNTFYCCAIQWNVLLVLLLVLMFDEAKVVKKYWFISILSIQQILKAAKALSAFKHIDSPDSSRAKSVKLIILRIENSWKQIICYFSYITYWIINYSVLTFTMNKKIRCKS